MSDSKPKKRAESLALENVKRIADVLRAERNDAIGLAQIKRQEADKYKEQLERTKAVLQGLVPELEDKAREAVNTCLTEVENVLKDGD